MRTNRARRRRGPVGLIVRLRSGSIQAAAVAGVAKPAATPILMGEFIALMRALLCEADQG
jgi:hypothetical protein